MVTYSSAINHIFELSFRGGNLNSNEGQDKNFTGELVIMGHGRKKARIGKWEDQNLISATSQFFLKLGLYECSGVRTITKSCAELNSQSLEARCP